MSDTNFQPIFDYIDEANKSLKEELVGEMSKFATKKDIAKLQNSVDAFAKNSKDTENKVSIQESKTERIEHWILKNRDSLQTIKCVNKSNLV